MIALVLILIFTCLISFLCSVMEGFILSVTTAEIENFKTAHPKQGKRLERFKGEIEGTTAAILTLNTVANVVGSSMAGWLAGGLFGNVGVAIMTACLTVVVLMFCEILPKSIGVFYRRLLVGTLTNFLEITRALMRPIVILAKGFIKLVLPRPVANTEEEREQEVMTLINKGTSDGVFSVTEREVITNTLHLDDRAVREIMTPLEEVVALQANERMGSVMRRMGGIKFSRILVFEESHFVGVVLREDLLHAAAMDRHDDEVRVFTKPVMVVADSATLADLLGGFLKNRQEIAVVEGSVHQTLGIVTMADVLEHLFGKRTAAAGK